MQAGQSMRLEERNACSIGEETFMLHHLYFASCVLKGGIYHYVLENRKLRFLEKTDCDRPMYLDVKKGSMQVVLRAPFEGVDPSKGSVHNSGLLEYAIRKDGSLGKPGSLTDTRGLVACHLCRYEGKTYVANYISGSVFSTGGQLREHTGKGPHPTRQEGPHLHFVQPSPDGTCLLAVDLGTDSICAYDENLKLLSTAHVPEGCGPRHLAYSDDKKTVFCVNELDSSVSVFAYENAELSLTQTVGVLGKQNRESTAAAIRVQGRYVYVSNRGEDSLSCLEWNGESLELRSVTPCGGKSPRDFLVVDDLLFCTNEASNNVTIFRVNGPVLEKLETEIKIPAPLCVAE